MYLHIEFDQHLADGQPTNKPDMRDLSRRRCNVLIMWLNFTLLRRRTISLQLTSKLREKSLNGSFVNFLL